MNEKLIVCLVEHPLWGYSFQPMLAVALSDVSFSILELLDKKSSSFAGLSQEEKELVLLSEKYSENTLMKNFSREKTTAAFRKNLKEETVEKYIRPVIETSQRKMVDIMRNADIPLFFRKEMKTRAVYDTEKITLPREQAEVIFNFNRTEENELSYFVQVKALDKVLNLKSRFFALIATDPAIVVIDRQLLCFDDVDAKKLMPFFTKDVVQIPARSYKTYLEKFVVGCVKKYDVKSTGFEISKIEAPKTAKLIFTHNFEMRPILNLMFCYGNQVFHPDEYTLHKGVYTEERGGEMAIRWFTRDAEWENAMQKTLLDNGLRKIGINALGLDESTNVYSMIDWLRQHRELLSKFTFSQEFRQAYYLGEIETSFQIVEKEDWFDIHCEVIFGEHRVPFTRFRNHILNNIREYVLPDETVVALPDEWFSKYADLMYYDSKSEDSIQLKRHNYQLLELFREKSAPNFQFSNTNIPVPEGINATLRPYQQRGFSWMVWLYKNHFGGCLADDMGLGKTLQTITLLQYIAQEHKMQVCLPDDEEPQGGQLSLFGASSDDSFAVRKATSLVVVPTSLLFNWQRELKRFAPSLRVCPYSGNKRERSKRILTVFRHYDVVLTTYGTLRNDIDLLSMFGFHHLILDESQYVKNSNSVTYKAVKAIKADYKLSLTGTPIENSLSDLWAQFNLINEGLLGGFTAFRTRYINPIERQNETQEEALLKMIRPFMLRRTKTEVAPELPPISEEVVYCDMSEEQAEQYQKEKNALRKSLILNTLEEGYKKIAFVALQGLTRLRLLANHPRFVDANYTGDSGKFEQVLMYIETLMAEHHKVLIFSSFVRQLRLYADYFDKQKWKYAWLIGSTPADDREREINRFARSKDVNCFFISLKAGGVGLNLTEADYVFILDPWWNPAAEMQAIGRSHRIGQHKNVMVYRFISSGTVEEKIRRLQENKSLLAEKFVNSANPLTDMTREDIENLLEG